MAAPGAQDEKDKQIEEMKKMLAEKDQKLKAMEEQLQANKEDDKTTSGGGANTNDEAESKLPPKTDVTLSLRGVPEYDSYPYSKAAEKFYFMASIKAPYFRSEQRAPIDLCCVVDESGSMSGDRIKLVKETVNFIIKNLESTDRFGIVGYSSGSRVVLPLTTMDQKGKEQALGLASNLRASGGTALCAGLVMGVNMMRQRTTKNDVASVMILTDGQANEGPTSAAEINSCVRTGKVSGGGYGGYNAYGGPPRPPQAMYGNRAKPRRMQQQMQGHPVPAPPQILQMPMQQQQQQMPPQMMQQQQILPQVQGYQQQQMPMQQQQQQMPIQGLVTTGPPAPGPVPPQPGGQNDMIEEAEVKQEEGGKDKKPDMDDLPVINTFGFGAGHNESLLESIAENGRGMYAFIENTGMIGDTFAECLGGLVSIIGQDIKVKVEAMNEVEINKCLSTGYTLTVKQPRKIHEISMKDLQSEENRELMFELKLPKVAGAKEKDPIVQLSVNYKNVVKDKVEILSNVCCINRIEGQQIGERNMELDVQYNRVLAANAMEEADDLANKGKLEEARKILSSASDTIQKSKSNKNQFSVNLVSDISMVQSKMQNRHQYQQQGGKMLKMNKKAHMMQRSVQSSAYASQSMYENRSKSSMKSKFKGYK